MTKQFLAEICLPGVEASVPLIRHFAGRVLAAAGHHNLDGVQLVVTELVGNAIVHTRSAWMGGLVTVEVTAIGDALARIEVSDEGAATVPRPRQAGDGDCHGRGLALVERLSARWGVRPQPLGTTVWAEVFTTEDDMTRDEGAGVAQGSPACGVEV
ncbi:ATP-binding protein [Nonomuraea sp. B12E4]|uniref:ATP-binding protein n=1 Tax=Nonomuraea sp. B12E4 TaxID=3153564 RepID=UPI00325CB4C6